MEKCVMESEELTSASPACGWSGRGARPSAPSPPPTDDGHHPLLEEVSPAYSAAVTQRALITWVHLGKTNSFRQVCDYYHRLERLEETFTEERRLESRRREYEVISKAPPLSDQFLKYWGHFYGYRPENKTPESDAPCVSGSVANETALKQIKAFTAVPGDHQVIW